MKTKLDWLHQKVNEDFIWPQDLNEAIKLWEKYTPHKNGYRINPPADLKKIKQVENVLKKELPYPYRQFLLKHNGIIFTWEGEEKIVSPIEDLPLLMLDFFANFKMINRKLDEKKSKGKPEINIFESVPSEMLNIDHVFPFGRNANNDIFLFYLDATGEFDECPILRFEQVGTFVFENSSFTHFLWLLNCNAHTHPQEFDDRLLNFNEN